MMKTGLAALATLSALAQATREPSQQDRARAFADAVNRPLVYHVLGEDQVRVAHGFENTTDDDRSCEILKVASDFMKTHLGLTAITK